MRDSIDCLDMEKAQVAHLPAEKAVCDHAAGTEPRKYLYTVSLLSTVMNTKSALYE